MRVLAAFFFNVLCNFAIGLLVAKFLGPAEYGRFALAFAVAVAVQTGFFDCLRLGATRFYSERVRTEDPTLRATLDATFVIIALSMGVGGQPSVSLRRSFHIIKRPDRAGPHRRRRQWHFRLQHGSRPRPLPRPALYTADPGQKYSGPVADRRRRLHFSLGHDGAGRQHPQHVRRRHHRPRGVARSRRDTPARKSCDRQIDPRAIHCRSFAPTCSIFPSRSPIARSSRLSTAFRKLDNFRSPTTSAARPFRRSARRSMSSCFRLPSPCTNSTGASKAKDQVARNMAIVIAVVLPACTGIWLTLPSIENVVVPVAFRGPFGQLLTLMMAGLFSSAIVQFGINPIFQIAKRTAPLIVAAVIACLVDALLIIVLPKNPNASSLAIAQTGAYIAALIALIVMATFSKPQWPRLRDLALAALATAAMAAALLPLREHNPGLLTLVEQVTAGRVIYCFFVYCVRHRQSARDRHRPAEADPRAAASVVLTPAHRRPRRAGPRRSVFLTIAFFAERFAVLRTSFLTAPLRAAFFTAFLDACFFAAAFLAAFLGTVCFLAACLRAGFLTAFFTLAFFAGPSSRRAFSRRLCAPFFSRQISLQQISWPPILGAAFLGVDFLAADLRAGCATGAGSCRLFGLRFRHRAGSRLRRFGRYRFFMNFGRRLGDRCGLRLWRAGLARPFRRRIARQRLNFRPYARVEKKFEHGIVKRLGGLDRRQMRRLQRHGFAAGIELATKAPTPGGVTGSCLPTMTRTGWRIHGRLGRKSASRTAAAPPGIALPSSSPPALLKARDDFGGMLFAIGRVNQFSTRPGANAPTPFAATIADALVPDYPRCRSARRYWRAQRDRSAPAHGAAARAR